MVDSAPQWEAVLRRQKEKNQADPNYRRSRHRSRSYVTLAIFDMKIKAAVACEKAGGISPAWWWPSAAEEQRLSHGMFSHKQICLCGQTPFI